MNQIDSNCGTIITYKPIWNIKIYDYYNVNILTAAAPCKDLADSYPYFSSSSLTDLIVRQS